MTDEQKDERDIGKEFAMYLTALVVGSVTLAEVLKSLNRTEIKKDYSAYFYAGLLLIVSMTIYFELWKLGLL